MSSFPYSFNHDSIYILSHSYTPLSDCCDENTETQHNMPDTANRKELENDFSIAKKKLYMSVYIYEICENVWEMQGNRMILKMFCCQWHFTYYIYTIPRNRTHIDKYRLIALRRQQINALLMWCFCHTSTLLFHYYIYGML